MNNHIRFVTGCFLLSCIFLPGLEGSVSASSRAAGNGKDTCLSVAGRRNLISNPGFETGRLKPDDWMLVVPGADRSRAWRVEVVKGRENVHGGVSAVKIGSVFNGVNSESSWLDRPVIESAKFKLIPGNKYYLLYLWANSMQVEDGHASLKIKYYDRKGKPLETRGHRWDTFYLDNGGRQGWQRYAHFVHPPDYRADLHGTGSVASMASVSLSIDNSSGSVTFDDIGLVPVSAEEYMVNAPSRNYRPPDLVERGAGDKPEDPPQESIGVRQKNGSWWFFSLESEPFWSVGLMFSANRFILDRTGLSRREYIKKANVKAGEELFFNQGVRLPSQSGGEMSLHRYIEWMNFSSEADIDENPEKWVAKDRTGNLIAEYTHYFPDVFSPVWQENAIREARKLLEGDGWVLDNKEVIGYWTDNEWAYGDLYDFVWGDTARYAFLDWLQGKNSLPTVDRVYRDAGSGLNMDVPKGFEKEKPYPRIEDLNRAWSSGYHQYRYRSFDQILEDKNVLARAHDDPLLEDLRAFTRLMYKVYVDTVVDNIRKVESEFSDRIGRDVSHLIFSNRFSIDSPAALTELRRNMDLFERFDVIAVNLYPGYNNSAMYYPRSLLELVRRTFHDTTGKPLYISEFGVAAEDASNCDQTPCLSVQRWRPQTVDTQENRGRAYNNIVSTLFRLPWVVGANWFQWTDSYGSHDGGDPRNCGLVDDNNEYYHPLTEMMRATNLRLAHLARPSGFELDDIDWSKTRINICEQ